MRFMYQELREKPEVSAGPVRGGVPYQVSGQPRGGPTGGAQQATGARLRRLPQDAGARSLHPRLPCL